MCIECDPMVSAEATNEAISAWRGVKSMLTRAEKSNDPERMRQAAERAFEVFDKFGYPDWWARAERLKTDAEYLRRRLEAW